MRARPAPSSEDGLMAYRITLIPGDGVGPEITAATVRVLEATGVCLQWDPAVAGAVALERDGSTLPEATLESIRRNGTALKGPMTTPVGTGFRSANVALRKELDLFACVRPCKTYPGVGSRYREVDLVVIRENTEDLYSGIEFEAGEPSTRRFIQFLFELTGREISEDSGLSIKPISAGGSERIVRFAFSYARRHGRRKVTAVHKANIMKFSDGLFLSVARRVAEDFPDVVFEDRIVDNMCMQLVQQPERYDVLVMPNLYGDIISDLCAGLIGGLGLAPGANIGEKGTVFEPTHGSAPDIAGKGIANPMAMILSGVLMLRHLGEGDAAGRLERAVALVIAEGRTLTPDMLAPGTGRAPATTEQVADAVIAALQEQG